ncbi:lactate racemase domain-containing protein [Candidatus Bipolaricaulota sp. J31]
MIFSYTPERPISEQELSEKLRDVLAGMGRPGERWLVIVPDDTRTLPMPAIFSALVGELAPRVRELAFLVALGTHPPMTEDQLRAHFGPGYGERPANVVVHQHSWDDPSTLVKVGVIGQEEMEEISRGLLSVEVPVEINRLVLEYDRILIVNPVFPHEVIGFSGGHKYFFPGVSGPQMVHVSHWLGALITNPKINGHKWTPVREMVERAAGMVPTPRLGLSLVLRGHDLVGIFLGEVPEAWEAAADLSSQVNIVWVERPYDLVISVAPTMYRELWTAGKCMYKLEPVVADGGTLIIYGPHIDEISPTHGKWLLEVGYHVRDYFLAQWEKFEKYPWAVLAHSTHVKGIGTYRGGVERPRIEVVLATGIPEEICRRINLGYRDPSTLDPEEYMEDEGVLVVPRAGEMLYRLADGTVPDIDKL